MRRNRDLVEILDDHERAIRRLKQALARGGGVADHGALTGLSDDDHSLYHTDARAVTWLAGRTELYLADGSRDLTGNLVIDDGGTSTATINMGDVDASDDGAFWHFTKRASDHGSFPNRLIFSEFNGTAWSDWLYVVPGGIIGITRDIISKTILPTISATYTLGSWTYRWASVSADRFLASNAASLSSPDYSFNNDLDSGVYLISGGRVGVVANGVLIGEFNNFGGGNENFRVVNGSANRPSYAFISDADLGVWRFGTNELGISTGGTNRIIFGSYGFKMENGMDVLPRVDNTSQLGQSGLRYIDVWAVDGTINTSDEAAKKNIGGLRFDPREFVRSVNPIQFKRRGGGKRWHVGFGAGQVGESMEAIGTSWGAFIDPAHGPSRGGSQSDGPEDDRFGGSLGLRYDELLPVLWEAWKATDTEAHELRARVEILETAISKLEKGG